MALKANANDINKFLVLNFLYSKLQNYEHIKINAFLSISITKARPSAISLSLKIWK